MAEMVQKHEDSKKINRREKSRKKKKSKKHDLRAHTGGRNLPISTLERRAESLGWLGGVGT